MSIIFKEVVGFPFKSLGGPPSPSRRGVGGEGLLASLSPWNAYPYVPVEGLRRVKVVRLKMSGVREKQSKILLQTAGMK
jgi:hypothetical protein